MAVGSMAAAGWYQGAWEGWGARSCLLQPVLQAADHSPHRCPLMLHLAHPSMAPRVSHCGRRAAITGVARGPFQVLQGLGRDSQLT